MTLVGSDYLTLIPAFSPFRSGFMAELLQLTTLHRATIDALEEQKVTLI